MSEVKDYFEDIFKGFDSIYGEKKPFLKKIIDKVFREGMRQRYNFAVNNLNLRTQSKLLDIGTGSARYMLPFLKKDIAVTGIDFSKNMIELARENIQKAELQSKIHTLLCGDFMDFKFKENEFDGALAFGFFDYIKNPEPFLNKINRIVKKQILLSFPKKEGVNSKIRKVYLKIKGCPVYFYGFKDVQKLALSSFSNRRFQIEKNIKGDYILTVYEKAD